MKVTDGSDRLPVFAVLEVNDILRVRTNRRTNLVGAESPEVTPLSIDLHSAPFCGIFIYYYDDDYIVSSYLHVIIANVTV